MAEAEGPFVRLTIDGGVARLVLDRPPLNVIHIPMLEQIAGALDEAAGTSGLKALVLQAEGRMFSAGVDVADHTPDRVGEMIPLFNRVCQALSSFPLPTVAAVQGHALGGGCELVLCCDMAVMALGARIGQPEIQLAVLAPVAALRLPEVVGPRWAARLLFTGEQIEAATAAEIGLVTRAVPPEDLEAAVESAVEPLTRLSGAAQRHNKRAFLAGLRAWSARLPEVESLYLEDLMATEDAHEGLQAFLEKRSPEWKDR